MANTKSPLQRSKMSNIKGFGENIRQLPLYLNVSDLDISLLYMVSLLCALLSHKKLDFGLSMWHWSYYT
jgi:hypothetical protein